MIPGLTTKLSEAAVASTTTITVKTDLVRVTGSTNIATIVAPGEGFSQICILVPVDGNVATVTTGNIAKAVTMPQNQTCTFVFSKKTALWYPGPIS